MVVFTGICAAAGVGIDALITRRRVIYQKRSGENRFSLSPLIGCGRRGAAGSMQTRKNSLPVRLRMTPGSGLQNVEVAAENGDGGLARTGALESAAVLQTGDSDESRRLRLGINPEGGEVRKVEQIIEVEAHVGTVRGLSPYCLARDGDNRAFSGTIAGTIAFAQPIAGRILTRSVRWPSGRRRRFANQVAQRSAIGAFRRKFFSFLKLGAPGNLAGVGPKHDVLARHRDNRGDSAGTAVGTVTGTEIAAT
jgi:hypothetical protein